MLSSLLMFPLFFHIIMAIELSPSMPNVCEYINIKSIKLNNRPSRFSSRITSLHHSNDCTSKQFHNSILPNLTNYNYTFKKNSKRKYFNYGLLKQEHLQQVKYDCCKGWERIDENDSGCFREKCTNNYCLNNGTCGHFKKHIQRRHHGHYEIKDNNFNESNKIIHARCICPHNFYGDRCENDRNECLYLNGGCEHICVNTYGGFRCECYDGYKLEANKCIRVNPCIPRKCSQLCTVVDGKAYCSCNKGYYLHHNRTYCKDLNECLVKSIHQCEHYCTNTMGSYKCSCKPGYVLSANKRTCIEIKHSTYNVAENKLIKEKTLMDVTKHTDTPFNLLSNYISKSIQSEPLTLLTSKPFQKQSIHLSNSLSSSTTPISSSTYSLLSNFFILPFITNITILSSKDFISQITSLIKEGHQKYESFHGDLNNLHDMIKTLQSHCNILHELNLDRINITNKIEPSDSKNSTNGCPNITSSIDLQTSKKEMIESINNTLEHELNIQTDSFKNSSESLNLTNVEDQLFPASDYSFENLTDSYIEHNLIDDTNENLLVNTSNKIKQENLKNNLKYDFKKPCDCNDTNAVGCDQKLCGIKMNCPPGLTGVSCSSLCPIGYYGKSCSFPCRCPVGSICSPNSGHCKCLSGRYSTMCKECPANHYGPNCKFLCTCIHGWCNPVNGQCSCKIGFIGPLCELRCPKGFYGQHCSHPCICLNGSNECDHIDGKCKCNPGFKGTYCEESCSEGYYGNNCQYKCNCGKNKCDPIDGNCICESGECPQKEGNTIPIFRGDMIPE